MEYRRFLGKANKLIMLGKSFRSFVKLINDLSNEDINEIRGRLIIAASLCGYASLKMAFNTDAFKLMDYFDKGYVLDLDEQNIFWQMGKPRRVGWYLILMTTGDVVVVEIEKNTTEAGKSYLRINEDNGGDSRPLKEYPWCIANYGPVPVPPVVKAKRF